MKRKSTPAATAIASAVALSATLRGIESARYENAYQGVHQHDRVTEINSSLLTQGYYSEPLTTYATGWTDDADLDAALQFFAPEVPVARRFEYHAFDNPEEFLSETDDLRPIRGDFKTVEYTGTKVDAHTDNRGLQIVVDLDEVGDFPNWREHYTQKLIRRIKRNSLRRSIALLSAAGVNTAKTWDVTAGKDPDLDVIQELIAAANISGVRPNRVGYGDTAFSKRLLAHRAQESAGGFGSAALTPEQIAAFLQVDQVLVSKSRYTSGAATKAEMLGNLVLMFDAKDDADREDPSNIKRFVTMGSADQGGGRYQVYEQQLGPKLFIIAVGHYELTKITSTLGIRKFTVS